MNTLDQVLETAWQMPYEQQEILIKILQNRRAEIAADAQQTLFVILKMTLIFY